MAQERLTLLDAVEQTLDANLDLASQRSALSANEQAIDIARSPLLPQITVGASAQVVEDTRSAVDRKNVTSRSTNLDAQLTQVIYDESNWADFQVQQHVYDQQIADFESFRLSAIRDAAITFFELDRSLALTAIQIDNRELTRQSLETTRSRVATGYSSNRELLRWELQLAQNDIAVENASTRALTDRFELNRARNRPVEEAIDPTPGSIDEHGFFYMSKAIAKATAEPDGDRRLRDYLVRFGIKRSPVIRSIDAAIEAQERVLLASKRAFWVPKVSAIGGVDHFLTSGGDAPPAPDDNTEWSALARVDFPLFGGGSKFATLRQARESLSSLRFDRRARVIDLDNNIRSAFALASAAYRNVDNARAQQEAAQKNYDYIYDGYVLGVAGILDLLDAQRESLSSKIASVNALYDFLAQLIAAEQQLALYPFLEDPAEMQTLVRDLAQQLGTTP